MKKVVDFPDSGTIKEEAANWLIRLDGDVALTKNEQEQLQEWLRRSQAHREQLQGFAELWGKMNVLTELAVPLDRSVKPRAATAWRPMRLAATASVVLVMTAIILISMPRWLIDSATETNGLYATAIGDQQSISLSDGSVVFLNTDSQIRVDHSDAYRDVHLLQGEAHFTVAKDGNRRFRVFAGSGRIEAVGTSFSVYLKEESVDVTVTEGRVALASMRIENAPPPANNDAPGRRRDSRARLTPLGELKAGQVATIETGDDDRGQIETLSNLRDVTERDLSRRIAWTNGTLVFSGKPLEEVVKEISRYTTVKIEFSDPAVASIKVGGLFPVGETETMFDALETTFGLDVTYLSKTHVLVSAENRP